MPNVNLEEDVKINLHEILGTCPGDTLQVSAIGPDTVYLSGSFAEEEAGGNYVLIPANKEKFIYPEDLGAWCWCDCNTLINVQQIFV